MPNVRAEFEREEDVNHLDGEASCWEAEMRTSMSESTMSFGEKSYVEAAAKLGGCVCDEEYRLHIALAEQRTRPSVFSPDFSGVQNARCATFGRCK